jgi:predicted MFS family arabinose efflux permease
MGEERKRSAKLSGAEILVLFVLASIQFANIMDFMIVMPLGPRYQNELHITPKAFGLLVSAYGICASLSGILAAWFIDRFDRKRALLCLYTGFIVATLLCAASPNYYLLLGARGLAGVFGGVMAAVVMAIVGDLFADARRGTATGAVMSAFSVATVAGVPTGLFLANKFGWWAPFAAIGGLSLPVLAMAWMVLPPLRSHLSGRRNVDPVKEFVEVITQPTHLRAYVLMILLVTSSFMVIPYLSIYIVNNVGRAETELPYIYLTGGAATLFTLTIIGRLSDRFGKLLFFRILAVATGIPVLMITNLPPGTWLVWILIITTLFFVFTSGRMVPGMAMITACAEPRHRASFLSVTTAVQHMAGSLATFAAGLILGDTEGGAPIEHYALVGLFAASATLASASLGGWLKPAPGGKDATANVEELTEGETIGEPVGDAVPA